MKEIPPAKYGREVRIVEGKLDGYTGRLLRMQGSRVKRLIVELPGFFAAGVEVQPEYIRFV
jgi:transcription antitermination factor NusG